MTPARVVAFITFFPQLVLGPIQRWRELAPQLADPRPTVDRQVLGLMTIALALIKKLVLAESLLDATMGYRAVVLDGAVLTPFDAWVYLLASAAYIYFDFSAYADLAVGIALMFGVRLIDGFNSPFRADSVAEFWRRWNVSLMRFFREALYQPSQRLMGKAAGPAAGVVVVMLACGAWHGAGAHFLVWGAMVAALILAERAFKRVTAWRPPKAVRRMGVLLAFLVPLAVFLHTDVEVSVALVARMFDLAHWGELPAHVQARLAAVPLLASYTQGVAVPFGVGALEILWLFGGWGVIMLCPSVPTWRARAHRWLQDARGTTLAARRAALVLLSLLLIVAAMMIRPGSNAFFYFQF